MCLPKEIKLNSRERKNGFSEFCQPCLVQKIFSLINPSFHRTDNCYSTSCNMVPGSNLCL